MGLGKDITLRALSHVNKQISYYKDCDWKQDQKHTEDPIATSVYCSQQIFLMYTSKLAVWL